MRENSLQATYNNTAQRVPDSEFNSMFPKDVLPLEIYCLDAVFPVELPS